MRSDARIPSAGPVEGEGEPPLYDSGIDPRLHALVVRLGRTGSGPGGGEARPLVPVLARLRSPKDRPDGLEIRSQNGRLVTGLLDLRSLVPVRRAVDGLKLATSCHATSSGWQSELGLGASDEAPAGAPSPDGGENVVVGVVDVDCAFANGSFQDGRGKTRFVGFWDQRAAPAGRGRPPAPYGYGREFTPEDIDQATASGDPYGFFGYEPVVSREDAHGTHVLDVAAGAGGVAPKAKLVFVHLDPEVADDGATGGRRALCDSVRLVEAVRYVFDVAGRLGLPAVVNISLGSQAGPHDGTSLVEQHFDAMLGEKGRVIVISAGNARREARHAQVVVPKGKGSLARVYWWLPRKDPTPNELDAWYPGDGALALRVGFTGDLPPPGMGYPLPEPVWATPDALRPGDSWRLFSPGPSPGDRTYRGSVHHRCRDSQNNDNQVFAVLGANPSDQAYACVLEFENLGSEKTVVEAWIDNDDPAGASSFFDNVCELGTITGIATGRLPIVVGSYQGSHHDDSAFVSFESSIGPVRGEKGFLPDLCAAGTGVPVLDWDDVAYPRFGSGTSLASPQVAGLAALLLEKDPSQTVDDVRGALKGAAVRPPGYAPTQTRIKLIGAGFASLTGLGSGSRPRRARGREKPAKPAGQGGPTGADAPESSDDREGSGTPETPRVPEGPRGPEGPRDPNGTQSPKPPRKRR